MYKYIKPFYAIFLVILLLLSTYTNSNGLTLLFFGASALLIFYPIYLLPVYFISSLMGDYFIAFSGISIARMLALYILLGFALKLLLTKGRISTKYLTILVLINLINFLSAAFSITGSQTVVISVLLNILIVIAFNNQIISNKYEVIKLLVISVFITSLYFSYIFLLNPYEVSADRVSISADINVNRYAMGLAQLTSILIAYIYYTTKYSKYFIVLPVIFMNFYWLILTGSRSATIGVIISFLILNLLLLKNRKMRSKLFLGIAIGCVTTLILISLYSSGSPVMDRFSIHSVTESGGSGRQEIWEVLFRYVIPENLLLGVGLGGFNVISAVAIYLYIPHPAHNFLIDMIAQVGLIGVFAYLSFFSKFIKELLSFFKINAIMVFPIMIVFTAVFNGIGETIFSERILWNGIALGCLFMSNSSNVIEKDSVIK